MTMELHPLCTLFPRLTGAEFDALCADIKANGLREPITTHDGMVLDGGNRYRACVAVGVEPMFREFDGGNLVSFVLSVNLHRRHMTPGQQAAIVASAQDWAKAQPARRPEKAGNVAGLSTVAQRAAESGASERTQRMADKVAKADPALAKRVAHGEVSLPKAVQQVSPKQEAKSAAPEQEDDGPSAADLLDQMQDEVRTAEAQAAEFERVMLADDGKAEAAKLLRRLEQSERAKNDAMAAAATVQQRAEFYGKQLARCGKAVGVMDMDRIAPAVEAFVRQHKKVAA